MSADVAVSSADEDSRSCDGVTSQKELEDIHDEVLKANKILKSKVKNFLERLKPFIETLENNRNIIDKNYTMTNRIVLGGSTVSAVGGGLMIAGTAAAPVTLGTSLSLCAVGGVMIAGGTTATLYCQYKDSKERKEHLEKCKTHAEEMEKERDELEKLHADYIEKCIKLTEAVQRLNTSDFFELYPDMLKHFLMGLQTQDDKTIQATVIKAAVYSPGICNSAHILGSGASSICKIVRAIKPTITIASKVTSHLGVALGTIGVLVDIVMGTIALVQLVRKTKCQESKVLTSNIEKAKDILKKIEAYHDYLNKEPYELFEQPSNAIEYSQENNYKKLKEENDCLHMAISEYKQKSDNLNQENKKLYDVIKKLEESQKALIDDKEKLQSEMKEQQLQFKQEMKAEIQRMQEETKQLLKEQMQQFLQQLAS